MRFALATARFFLMLLLVVAGFESAAARPSSGKEAERYSVVKEYKQAYARPHRTLFGKRKLVSKKYARLNRPHRVNSFFLFR